MEDSTFTNMARIPAGTFTMGSPDGERWRRDNEGPQHEVTVSAFCMGKFPVTQREYEAVTGKNPSYKGVYPVTDSRNDGGQSGQPRGGALPVEGVSWYEAVEYCNRLSLREGLAPAYTVTGDSAQWDRCSVQWDRNADGFRLPTEAEWEYACRAGTTTPYYSGKRASGAAWYEGNSGQWTHPVGGKKPNAWGLFDTHGNVWEWCWDWYGGYSGGAQTDPAGAQTGAYRVLRGGCCFFNAGGLRSAYRYYIAPHIRSFAVGFRVARSGLPA